SASGSLRVPPHSAARARISTTRQFLVLDIGAHSATRTKSPVLQAFSASWACSLVERRMYLPYSSCLTWRSTSTVTVLSILLLTTRPSTVCSFLPLFSVISAILTSSHRGRCSHARSRGAHGVPRGSWRAGPWPAACAARTAPCAARPGGPGALPPTSVASAWCPSAHRPGHESGGHRELGGGEAERLARGRLVDALDLVDHAAGLHLGHPVLHVALARAHADLDGLLGDRLVGEHADPHLAAALHVAADRTARGLDLARGELAGGGRLQPVLAEADGVAVPGQAVIAALVHLAELGSLGLQHGYSLASRSRRGPRGRSARSPRSPRSPPRGESSCFSWPTWAKSKISPL